MAKKEADSKQDATTKKKKRPGIRETWKQIVNVYKFTRRYDKNLPWVMVLCVAIPVAVSVLIPLLWYRRSVVGWILTVLAGVFVGFTVAVYVLTNRSNKAVYNEIDGHAGATVAVLRNINNKAYHFDEQPIWADPHSKDVLWMGTSFAGIYLVGEGDYGRVQKAMDVQEKKIRRITQGSAIPIIRISVGNGPKQVPLNKLRREIVRHRKFALRQDELTALNNRLRTIRLRNSTMNMPKGIDPNRVHVSPRAMRGK